MNLKSLVRRELLLKESEIRVAKNISIPDDIRKIQKVFKANGKALFVVGGAIRDALLGRKPKDWDLATDATPDEVILILKPQQFITNIIETGKAFGVINAFTDNDEFEVATFRKDSSAGDGRRPDSVEFADIATDVLRRDLTINALFFDLPTPIFTSLLNIMISFSSCE
jgi:tRNA nucleotidyltransferase/poly(A) polymerase